MAIVYVSEITVNDAGNVSYIVQVLFHDVQLAEPVFDLYQPVSIDTTLPLGCPECEGLSAIEAHQHYIIGGYYEVEATGQVRRYLDVQRNTLVSPWPQVVESPVPKG